MKKTKLFHSIIAFTLILSILFSLFVFGPVVTATAEGSNTNTEGIEYWSGKPATDFAGGSGTKEDPFLIDNGEQLYLMVKVYSDAATASGSVNTKTYFKLRKDIYLNNVTDADLENPTVDSWNAKGFKPWFTLGGTSTGFCGNLDGDGHTVSGLFAYGGFVGLIPLLADGGNVENINLKNSYIYGNTNGGAAGGIVGYVYSYWKLSPVTVSNCLVDNIVVDGGSARTGGIVGGFYNLKVTVTNCAVTNTTLTSHYESYPDYVSGIVGYGGSDNVVSVVKNCYTDSSVHPVNATSDKTNFDIIDDKVTYTNVYTSATKNFDADEGVTYLTDEQMKGDAAKEYMQGFNFSSVWQTVENDYPVNISNNIVFWSGEAATKFAGGSGTEADPFIIENADQLYYLTSEASKADNANFTKGNYFKITKDIYINDVTNGTPVQNIDNPKSWGNGLTDPTGNNAFYGTLDGDGHVIYGLYVYNYINPGLFGGIANGCTIKNLGFDNLYFEGGKGSGGAIAGYANYAGLSTSNPAKIENCYVVNGSMVAGSSNKLANAGGFIGNASNITLNISNCYVHDVNFSASTCNGSIMGKKASNSTVKVYNSYFLGKVPVTNDKSGHNAVKYYNVYTDQDILTKESTDADEVLVKLSTDQMKGENAKTYMPGLSYRFVWETVKNGYPVINLRDGLWDGKAVTDFSSFEGAGTEKSPYLIKNGAQLAFAMVTNSKLNAGTCYKLANDIVLNDTAVAGWEKLSPKPWLHQTTNRWVGTLDGDGHTIEGLYMNTSTKRPGLVSYSQGTFKNINFTGASITYTSTDQPGVAIVAAQTSGPTNFENIYIDETCKITSTAVQGVAAIAGRGYDKTGIVNIKNCAVLATINAAGTQCGAIAGSYWETKNGATVTIQNCFSSTNLPLLGGSDAITNPGNNYSVVEDTNGTNVLESTDLMKGDNAKTYMPGLSYRFVWETVDGGYPVINLRDGLWDGSAGNVVSSYDDFDGEGTKESPYLIENGDQLYYAAIGCGSKAADAKYYKLTKDIILNDTSVDNWEVTANPWGVNTAERFNGTLDGDGHTIEGLYINVSRKDGRYGLFSYIGLQNSDASADKTKIAEIKNLNFVGASVTNAYTTSVVEGVGIVAGQTSGKAAIENIYIDKTSKASGPNVSGVAGIVGRVTQTVTINNCAVLGTFTGKSAVGSFLGLSIGGSSSISNSYSAANVPVTVSCKPTLKNTYATVKSDTADYDGNVVLVTDEQITGDAAKINMPGLVFGAVWEIVKDDYPVIVKNPIESWDGKTADKFAAGNGTAENPYIIENGGQLYKMVSEYSNMNIARKPADQTDAQPHFRITKDINLGNNQWYVATQTGYPDSNSYTQGFNGVIYGDGHTIYGLYDAGNKNVAGLIPVAVQGAEIHDLHLTYSTFKKTAWNLYASGAFIGLAKGNLSSAPIIIRNCSFTNSSLSARAGASAFVGYVRTQSVNINNCYAYNNNIVIPESAEPVQNIGAFVGIADGSDSGNSIVIKDSYCDIAPTIYFKDAMARITTFDNVYTTYSSYDDSVTGLIKVTATQLQGANAKETLAGFNFNQVWVCGKEGEYPVHKAYNSTIWNGREASAYAGGDGTAESPYEIATAEQLYKLANADTASTKGKYFKLTADITISNIYDGWANDNPYTWAKKTAYLTGFTYSNSFAGTLDGDGHTVTGLYITDNITNGGTYAYGLIPFVSANAIVKNIKIDNVYIDVRGNAFVGAVIGAAYSKGNDATNPLANAQIVGADITNCDITSNSPSTTGDIFGGAVGGLKVELCNNEEKYDNVISYNAANLDDAAVLNIRGKLLGKNDDYITDINAKDGFNVCDLLSAKKSLLYKATEDNSDEYEVVWLQDFNGSGIDYSVWSRNTTMGTTNPVTKLTTIKYADVNKVQNGTLTLSCNDSGETVSDNTSTFKVYNVNYGLDTGNSMSFKYGKLTMRAKIPFYRGAFPSLWLTSRGAMGNETITPYSTEIDIFEVFGNGQYDLGDWTWNHTQMVACIHKWYNNENGISLETDCSCGTSSVEGNNYIKEESKRSTYISDADIEKWQIVEFEWDENKMTFSVRTEGSDKVIEYYSVTRAELEGKFGITGKDYSAEGIFDQFLSIRLNNHMHTRGGRYEYSSSTDIDASKLNYEIDYIKIEQKNDGKSAINLK